MIDLAGLAARRDELVIEDRDGVRWIVFNRPQARNAMTWDMYSGLVDACEEINRKPHIRALILTGSDGQAFVAGTDITQFRAFTTEKDAIDYETRCDQVLTTLESVRIPTICAIAGPCTGAGAAIACACDFRIGAPSATFGIPIARTIGNCLSAANCVRIASLIGIPLTKDLLMRARLMGAAEMLSCGLIAEVTPDEESLLPRAEALAAEIAANAPLTIWATKEALRLIRNQSVPTGSDTNLIRTCYTSDDFRAGVEAFLSKGKPNWTGH